MYFCCLLLSTIPGLISRLVTRIVIGIDRRLLIKRSRSHFYRNSDRLQPRLHVTVSSRKSSKRNGEFHPVCSVVCRYLRFLAFLLFRNRVLEITLVLEPCQIHRRRLISERHPSRGGPIFDYHEIILTCCDRLRVVTMFPNSRC